MLSDPLLIIALLACLAVLVILLMGINSFRRGGEYARQNSNKFMRWRLIAQFIADRAHPRVRLRAPPTGRLTHGRAEQDLHQDRRCRGNRAWRWQPGGQALHAGDLLWHGGRAERDAGLARLHAGRDGGATGSTIQNDLFDLGADLCTPNMEKDAEREYPPLRIVAAQVARLETEIDAMNAKLQPLRSFILPGGTALAAHLHLCRTVARRAERQVVELATMESVNPEAVKYLNRLSRTGSSSPAASPTTTARQTCCGFQAQTADKPGLGHLAGLARS
jgi:hypothetical protein